MELNEGFGKALRLLRKDAGLTQESFVRVSGRTYLSALERGLQSPTLEKVQALSETIGVHPLTLLTASFILSENAEADDLFATVKRELGPLETAVDGGASLLGRRP